MPINIELRKDSRIVTMNIDGKAPIRTRSGSFNFHNSMELLCIAYGSCVGKELWTHCRYNNINILDFESFVLTMENNVIYFTVQHPKDMSDELRKEIVRLSQTCPVSKLLVNKPIVRFVENETPIETLRDESRRSRCCGG